MQIFVYKKKKIYIYILFNESLAADMSTSAASTTAPARPTYRQLLPQLGGVGDEGGASGRPSPIDGAIAGQIILGSGHIVTLI